MMQNVLLKIFSFFQLVIVLLASSAQTTCTLAKRIGETCYNSIYSIKFSRRHGMSFGRKAIYCKFLTVILSQTYLKPPVFSISGFFVLGYKWVFIIIDTTISYLVVVLYFFNKGS